MELVPLGEIGASYSTGTQLHVKQEPQSEFLDNFIVEPEPSVMASDNSFQRIKKLGRLRKTKISSNFLTDMDHFSDANDELVSEEKRIENPRKKQRTNKPGNKNAVRNDKIEDGKNESPYSHLEGRPEFTQLPCIVNIKSSAVLERPSQGNHNGTLDTSNGILNTSLQSAIPERICESNDHVALNEAVGQNSSNNNFTSKVYEILVDIQSTLKDLKAEVAENSKKIDQLQKCLPQPWSWKSAKSDFNFPVSTEEQLLELEKQLENNEMATKLVVHLTSRTYTSWREMVLLCLKYMISRNVAMLYNLNGIKGTKKKFRDLNICNILVECVQYKFKEATTLEIHKRISLILAGAKDWQGSRHKKG